MAQDYFSDREQGSRPRIQETIGEFTWGGIVSLVYRYIRNGGFGVDFPVTCPDNDRPTGTDMDSFGLALQAEIPDVIFPLTPEAFPGTELALDLVEFCYEHIAAPSQGTHHPYFDHYHLTFNRDQGRLDFRENIERIFARNGVIYELREDGRIARLGAPVFRETLSNERIESSDGRLNELLEHARTKFLDPNSSIRREGIEKLWDAWERLKSLKIPADKKASITALLDSASTEAKFRELLEEEAINLTAVGNKFHIRHSEINQIELESDQHADYLFYRLFALIWFLLRTTK